MSSPLPAAVLGYLERARLTSTRVVPLTGDASDRRYFRVLSGQDTSFVLAVYIAPFEYASLPFVNVAELLAAIPVPVPRILDAAPDLGVLALEDLGDVTLQAHVGVAPAATHAARYRQAVALIEALQRRGAELADPRFLPYGIAFDEAKLTWELEFFAKHFLEAYRGVVWAPGERETLRDEFSAMAGELAAEPHVLCHRDYHSRNLMLTRDRLFLIDFQDARLGPDTYDLASLLRDSYVDVPGEALDELIAYFLALKGQAGREREFRRRFDLMALQRNLKALGTFGYQTTARSNPVYIQYMARTLGYVRENLRKYPRFDRLSRVFSSHVPELA